MYVIQSQFFYSVAIGSRSPPVQGINDEGHLAVALDATKPDSIKQAFAAVTKQFGPPNVVIYNGTVNFTLLEDGY